MYEDRIWLGNYQYANHNEYLLENNIKTVISCLDLGLSLKLPGTNYIKFAVKGCDSGYLDRKDDNFEKYVL